MGLTLVSRAQWKADPRSAGEWPMQPKRTDIFIHHSVTLLTGPEGEAYDGDLDPTDDPCRDMKNVERVGLDRFGRFPYSFCIHPSGVILEGAGHMIGAHTGGQNSKGYGLCFLGNFQTHYPTVQALGAAGDLIELLAYAGNVVTYGDGLRLSGHRDHKATACPGHHIYTRLWTIPVLGAASQ